MTIKCMLCEKNHFKNLGGLQLHITKSHKNEITIKEYYIKYIDQNIKICPICKEPSIFIGFSQGYTITCKKLLCRSIYANQQKNKEKQPNIKDELIFEKNDTIKTFLIKMLQKINPKGIFRYMLFKQKTLHEELIKLQKEKNLSSYNESIYWIINDLKVKPACPKYSDKCISILKFQTIESGYQKSCQKCCTLTPEYKQKIQKTYDEKYNGLHPLQTTEIKEKIKQSNLDRLGVEWAMQNEEVKQKAKETLEKNYGPSGLANPEIKQKRIQNAIIKIGVEHHTKLQSVQETKRNTCTEKYGVDQWMRTENAKQLFKNKWLQQKPEFENYVKKLLESRNLKLISEYSSAHDYILVKCKNCNTEFSIVWNNFQQGGANCQKCYPVGGSHQEYEISEYIKSLNISNIITHDRNIIKPLELDIIIPDLKIAIEYCGLWCHSSGGNAPHLKNKDYHLIKLQKCTENQYNLITIFEDEWVLKKEIVKSRLSYILNKSNQIKINGRECIIKEINFEEKKLFLIKNHLQSDCISKINLGAFFKDKLVSVMTFSHPSLSKGQSQNNNQEIYELSRFCSDINYHVIGIANKLISFFKINYQWKIIFSYADRRWSSGKVYEKMGFQLESISGPNYWYWGKEIQGRKHRFNFRKNNLTKMKSFNQNLTEYQIMALEGYAWIYDCGNLKYTLKNQ